MNLDCGTLHRPDGRAPLGRGRSLLFQDPTMTRKTATRDETTNSVPFVVFAIDFQLKMIRNRIEETVAANDDLATAELRRCWARAQGFVSAARTALGRVSNAQYEVDHSRVYPSKPTKRS